MAGSLVVLTGASGAGKTTLARSVEKRGLTNCQVLFFDSIGVPCFEQMRGEYGVERDPGAAWQRAMTLRWMERIREILDDAISVLFEGQMRIAFIREALASRQIGGARVVLIDCDDSTRARRLYVDRAQSYLASYDMMNWARYLREEANAAGVEVLDTGRVPTKECVDLIVQWLDKRHSTL